MVRMTITIDDSRWPKLRMILNREMMNQPPIVSIDDRQYDLAYDGFEGIIHNHLRPMVEELIQRKKRR